MPVALHTVSPPDSDGLKLLRLTVPHDSVAPVLVDVYYVPCRLQIFDNVYLQILFGQTSIKQTKFYESDQIYI